GFDFALRPAKPSCARRANAWLFIVAGCLAAPVLACSMPDSYVVLDLRLDPAGSPPPITGITKIVVDVVKGSGDAAAVKPLTYSIDDPAADKHTIDAVRSRTLAVSFSGDETGDVTFYIDVWVDNCIVGHGATTVPIQKGAIAS